MTDDATVDFYNKYVGRLRNKLDETITSSLQIETQLWIAKEQIEQLKEQNEKLEKKVKSLEKKVSE